MDVVIQHDAAPLPDDVVAALPALAGLPPTAAGRGAMAHALRIRALSLWRASVAARIVLGGVLRDIERGRYYQECGYATFEGWLEAEAIPLRSAYRYMGLWDTYAVQLGIIAGPAGRGEIQIASLSRVAEMGVVKAEMVGPALVAATRAAAAVQPAGVAGPTLPAAAEELMGAAATLTVQDLRTHLREREGQPAPVVAIDQVIQQSAESLGVLAGRLRTSPFPGAVLEAMDRVIDGLRGHLAQDRSTTGVTHD